MSNLRAGSVGGERGFDLLCKQIAPAALHYADSDNPKCHTSTIQTWIVGDVHPEASVMWLYGAARTGKSSIARSIAEWCQDKKLLLGSFFFSRSDPSRNDAERFIATLAYDITRSVPPCRALVEQAVELDPHVFNRTLDTQLLQLILEPLSQINDSPAAAEQRRHHAPPPHVLVIDGLDECEDSASQTAILQLIVSALHHPIRLPALKVLIASRPTEAIQRCFDEILVQSVECTRIALSNGDEQADTSNKVFQIKYLTGDKFTMSSAEVGSGRPVSSNKDELEVTGKVTCSVSFHASDGRGLVAIGCSEGVWIGFRYDPKSIMRVLRLKMVTQCAVLEEFSIFLVLADKVLYAYHIEALVPSPSKVAHPPREIRQRISKEVHFFNVGVLRGRTLLVYMTRSGKDSNFRLLEPVRDSINNRVRNSRVPGWFRVYRNFFLPCRSFDIGFLKKSLVIFTAKGIVAWNLQVNMILPRGSNPHDVGLLKRCKKARPIGLFRFTDNEFLVCYDGFGLYLNKHGEPSRSGNTIEWGGIAERAVMQYPYFLLFNPYSIEIRHISTGRLAQTIAGTDIRWTWSGRGNSPSSLASSPADDGVHFVMSDGDPLVTLRPGTVGSTTTTVQQVCELVQMY